MAVDQQETMVEVLSTSYLVAGEGTPLLLLHALEESAFDWRWVMPELSRNYLVYAPDLPGFGDSAKPTAADYSSTVFERFTAAFLDALGIEHVAVVGNSLGGLIALRLALSTPDRVRPLGLVAALGSGGRSPRLCCRLPYRVMASWRYPGAKPHLELPRELGDG